MSGANGVQPSMNGTSGASGVQPHTIATKALQEAHDLEIINLESEIKQEKQRIDQVHLNLESSVEREQKRHMEELKYIKKCHENNLTDCKQRLKSKEEMLDYLKRFGMEGRFNKDSIVYQSDQDRILQFLIDENIKPTYRLVDLMTSPEKMCEYIQSHNKVVPKWFLDKYQHKIPRIERFLNEKPTSESVIGWLSGKYLSIDRFLKNV